MSGPSNSHAKQHHHTEVKTLAIRQRDGVPYEVERKVCKGCAAVLDERRIKRAAA